MYLLIGIVIGFILGHFLGDRIIAQIKIWLDDWKNQPPKPPTAGA